MKAQHALEHLVWKSLKEYNLAQEVILVALSGGADSVALLKALSVVHEGKVRAAYFHHGEGQNSAYREAAQIFCGELCLKLNIPFQVLKSNEAVQSEGEYRELRYKALNAFRKENQISVLALAHHQDDLLETRLMRLIRGTGLQGLGAMEVFKSPYLRPLLSSSKLELLSYVDSQNLSFVEDPTNIDTGPLRNWIRRTWLPQLEAKQEGASASLARSLATIAAEGAADDAWGDLLRMQNQPLSAGLSRVFYATLTESQQRRLLAQYIYALGKRDFSRSHIEEIQKRLDNSQKVITFKVGGCLWDINAEQVKAQILE